MPISISWHMLAPAFQPRSIWKVPVPASHLLKHCRCSGAAHALSSLRCHPADPLQRRVNAFSTCQQLWTRERGPRKFCDPVTVRRYLRESCLALVCVIIQELPYSAACYKQSSLFVHEPLRPHPEHEAILWIRRERFLHRGWNKAALACCSWFKRRLLAHPRKMQCRQDRTGLSMFSNGQSMLVILPSTVQSPPGSTEESFGFS